MQALLLRAQQTAGAAPQKHPTSAGRGRRSGVRGADLNAASGYPFCYPPSVLRASLPLYS